MIYINYYFYIIYNKYRTYKITTYIYELLYIIYTKLIKITTCIFYICELLYIINIELIKFLYIYG